MKSWKVFWMFVVAGTLCSGFLTACGKKGDDSNVTYGNLTSDGQTVSTKSVVVQGVQLNMVIRNINAYATGYQQTYCYTYPCNQGMGSVTFETVTNGFAQMQQTTNGSWTNWQNQGNWWLSSTGGCTDTTCSYVIVSVFVTPYVMNNQNYEYRQIAVKKDVRNNKVVNVREYTVANPSMARSLQQLMMEL